MFVSDLVDVTVGESDESDESPSRQECEEQCQANDIGARPVSDGTLEIGIELKRFSVILDRRMVRRRTVQMSGTVDVRRSGFVFSHFERNTKIVSVSW